MAFVIIVCIYTCVSTLALSISVLASAINPLIAQPVRQTKSHYIIHIY